MKFTACLHGSHGIPTPFELQKEAAFKTAKASLKANGQLQKFNSMCSGCVFSVIESVLATPNLDSATGLVSSLTGGKKEEKPEPSGGIASFLGGKKEPEPEPEPEKKGWW